MAFRSVATQAVTLLRLRGIPTVSNNSSSVTNTTTNTLRSLWVPLARRFATAVEDAEGETVSWVLLFFLLIWLLSGLCFLFWDFEHFGCCGICRICAILSIWVWWDLCCCGLSYNVCIRAFIAEVLDGLHYAASHEWVKVEGSTAIVGISDHAQVCFSNLFQSHLRNS